MPDSPRAMSTSDAAASLRYWAKPAGRSAGCLSILTERDRRAYKEEEKEVVLSFHFLAISRFDSSGVLFCPLKEGWGLASRGRELCVSRATVSFHVTIKQIARL
jgi:hypothetical protein